MGLNQRITALGLVLGMSLVAACDLSPDFGPLSLAARTGDVQAVRALLSAGADPNAADGPRRSRALANAARVGRLDTMAVLLAAGADPDLADVGGNRWIPLMHALHKHRTASVRFLLEHGARADGPDGLTLTPLMMAAATGQIDAVRLLLDRGANPRRPLPEGGSILDLAVSGGALTDIDEPLLGACHLETVQLLVERAPDLRMSRTWRARLAGLFARMNGCQAALDIVSTRR